MKIRADCHRVEQQQGLLLSKPVYMLLMFSSQILHGEN